MTNADADVVTYTAAKLRELLAAAEDNERKWEHLLADAEREYERAVKDTDQVRRAVALLTEAAS